ncbi:MAG: 2-phospho-L-lactate guanylyltransferase [Methanosphaera sp. rholeuAM6]|nr:MAG: 2-phospho-L-lactate guanylyltransferase [Methanosphaera sp. rholeuAM6]
MKDLIAIIPVSSFNESKTRLSPFLTKDERIELLKVMLKDIIHVVRSEVEEIVIVSKDINVKSYATKMNINFVHEKEHEDNFLNNAIHDAITEVKLNFPNRDILILPSDIPLIKKQHITSVKNMDNDLIISPSKGGGTNLLCFNSSYDYETQFGDMSYFKHLNVANELNMSINLIESFYVSLDMNTPEDLGELLLHGVGTFSFDFLRNIGIIVNGSHGKERLDVRRKDEK